MTHPVARAAPATPDARAVSANAQAGQTAFWCGGGGGDEKPSIGRMACPPRRVVWLRSLMV